MLQSKLKQTEIGMIPEEWEVKELKERKKGLKFFDSKGKKRIKERLKELDATNNNFKKALGLR